MNLPIELILQIGDLIAQLSCEPFDMVKLAIATHRSDFLAEYEYCASDCMGIYSAPRAKLSISSLQYYCSTHITTPPEEEYIIMFNGRINEIIEARTPTMHLYRDVKGLWAKREDIWWINGRQIIFDNAVNCWEYNLYHNQIERASLILWQCDRIFANIFEFFGTFIPTDELCESCIQRIDKKIKAIRH